MKRILITGKNSYIGTSVERWLADYGDKYSVHTLDVKDAAWEEHDFSTYDVVFHVAGIAHVPTNSRRTELYYRVNRDLAVSIATKASEVGVRHFILMSSILVFGDAGNGIITRNCVPTPRDIYGESKLQAEKGVSALASDKFCVSVVRSPMVYGRGCRGNYPLLSKFARITPFVPYIENNRSIIHIDNLCEFVRQLMEQRTCGVFHPQNERVVSTRILIEAIARVHGRKPHNLLLPQWSENLLMRVPLFRKMYGNLYYTPDLSMCNIGYHVRKFSESIFLTERGEGR